MDDRSEMRDSGFNPPAVVMVRIAYVLYLCCAVVAVVSAVYVAVAPYTNLLMCAVTASVAWMLRAWLQEPEQYELIRDLIEDEAAPPRMPQAPSSSLEELIVLLRELRQHERSRGGPDFDPWALQTVRSRISQLVASDPSLQPLFSRASTQPDRGE